MCRWALSTFLLVQYQRSRNTSASATKMTGMPLSSASSTAPGNSNLTLADKSTDSPERSTCNCASSVLAAQAGPRPAPVHRSTAATSQPSPLCQPLLQQCVIKTIVFTVLIVRDGCLV